MPIAHRHFASDSTEGLAYRLARVAVVVGLALVTAVARGQTMEVTRRGHALSQVLDAMNVERLWLPGRDVDWKTGAPGEATATAGRPRTHSADFVVAACRRLGIDIPRPTVPFEANAANTLCDWLRAEGLTRGWRTVKGAIEAQEGANAGAVIIATFKSADPDRDGHVAIVRPSTKSEQAVREEGPQVTQAGPENFRSASLKTGLRQFAGAWPAGVRFFAHNRAAPPRRNGTIDARQAVRIAERFMRENGYTDFVPDDLSRLVPESMEFAANPRDWVKDRHNELKPQAVGYRKGSRNDPEGWTVGFALVDAMNKTPGVGRAVTMDAKGRRARVEHMGFFLKGLEPRPD
jgi:hypothetical protein